MADPFDGEAAAAEPIGDGPIRIQLEAVESSNLSAYGYDAGKQILAVQFKKDGRIFHYAGVTLDTAMQFGAAESKGRFYATEIRGKYTGRRMTGPCPDCGDEGWVGDRCNECGCSLYEDVPYTPKEQAS